MGFIIRGFIWDIPILIVAYVLFWGPNHRSRAGVPAKRITGLCQYRAVHEVRSL